MLALDLAPYLTAFSIGLIGSPHCMGMCGGISGALTFSIANPSRDSLQEGGFFRQKYQQVTYPLLFNLGRVLSYSFVGFIVGGIGYFSNQVFAEAAPKVFRLFMGVSMVLIALQLANWWGGAKKIELLGQKVWGKISPQIKKILPIDRSWKALAVGVLWGWIPCGMVYSVLFMAATTGDNLTASLTMLCFGLGTVPLMTTFGLLSKGVTQRLTLPSYRRVAAMVVLMFGLWTFFGALYMTPGHWHH